MSTQLPSSGQRYNVGGYSLYAQLLGQQPKAGPTVIFEAGVADSSLIWSLVAPRVAQFAPVFLYDRAGYGWSEPAPTRLPRTLPQATRELHTLLAQAQIRPPYILVGHAYGSLLTRLYAQWHPAEVAGMVLITALHEDEWTPRFPVAYRDGLARITTWIGLLRRLARLGLPQLLARLGLLEKQVSQRLPLAVQRDYKRLSFQAKALDAAYREMASLPTSVAELRGKGQIGEKPLVVLYPGQLSSPMQGVSSELISEVKQLLNLSQSDLAGLSSRSMLIFAEESGYHVQLDQPTVVVDLIRYVVEHSRTE